MRSGLVTLVLLGLIAQVGCQSTGTKPLAAVTEMTLPWEGKKEPRKAVPDRLVGTWAEAVRHNPEVGAERGFGGRLFFYDRQGTDPIRVEGQLVVYAFDENDRLSTDHRPSRRYVFPPQQFVKHESESDLGVSYSFWLPWDQVGGEQADVSLIARFEPLQGGGLVVGDQTRHRLPGRARTSIAKGEAAPAPSASQVQPAVAEETGGNVVRTAMTEESPKAEIVATTIPLPRGFERHLSGPRAGNLPQRSATPKVAPPSAATPQPPVAPTIPANTPVVPEFGALPQAPMGPGEVPRAEIPHYQPGPMKTSVTLLSPGESVRRSVQPRSFGYQQSSPQAQATPASSSIGAR